MLVQLPRRVGDRGAVTLDVGRCPVQGSFEPLFGPLEDLFGDVEFAASLAPAAATTAGEAPLRRRVGRAGLAGSLRVDCEHLAVRRRRPIDVRQVTLGCGDGGRPLCSLGRARFDGVLGHGESVSGVVEHIGEPVRDPASARLTRRRRRGWHRPVLGGEVAALGDGGDVGPVDSEDAVEDVAGLGDVVVIR